MKQSHVARMDWKYVTIKTKDGESIQIKMDNQLIEGEFWAYNELMKKCNDMFA